jgi:methionine aminopeptidase
VSIESPRDWNGLRRVGGITRDVLEALARETRAGVTTADLDVMAAAILARTGAQSAPTLATTRCSATSSPRGS